MCAWLWLSYGLMPFKNYSYKHESIVFSCHGCLEGVTDF